MPIRVEGRAISRRGLVFVLFAALPALLLLAVVGAVALASSPVQSSAGTTSYKRLHVGPASPSATSTLAETPPAQTSTETPTTPATRMPTTTPTCAPFQGTNILIYDFYFDPVTYLTNSSVFWSNNGSTAHTATSDTGAFDLGPIQPGVCCIGLTYLPFGTYPYHCRIHPQMTGVVIVQPVCIVTPTPWWHTPTPCLAPTPLTTPTPCANTRFTDVQPSDYFYEAVRNLYCVQGAVSGYADNTFRPGNFTTRGQMSKIAVLAMHWPLLCADPYRGYWLDVPPGHPLFYYVTTATVHGIISGYGGDGTFRPNNLIRRGQLAKLVVLAMMSRGWTLECPAAGHFRDVPSDNVFYCYIETAYLHGVVSGYADGTFRPDANTTRGQAAKALYQAISHPSAP